MLLSAARQSTCLGTLSCSVKEPTDRVERLLFGLVCLFLVSESYLVPLVAVGPSWAIWPNLSDVVIACMAAVLPWRSPRLISGNAQKLALFGWVIVALWTTSLCVITLYALPRIGFDPLPGDPTKPIGSGITELYRMIQCQLVLLSTVSIRWTPKRLKVIGWMSAILWFATAGFVLLTFTGLVSTKILGHQLPLDPGRSGKWSLYAAGLVDSGVGAVSYNHAYTGTQLILTAGLYLYLQRPKVLTGLSTALLLTFCIFVSGSRVALLAALPLILPLVVVGIRQSIPTFTIGILITAIVLTVALPQFEETHKDSFARQESMSSSLQEDGFAGRTTIWQERSQFILSNPNRWLLGTGVGATLALGDNAHMQFLQVLLELGAFGLIGFLAIQAVLLRKLWPSESNTKILFWTNLSLLITCFSQETLYPVPAFPSFLQLYVFAMAIGVLRAMEKRQDVRLAVLGSRTHSFSEFDALH